MKSFNPKQATFFDDFAAGAFVSDAPAPATGSTAVSRDASRRAAEAVQPKCRGLRLKVLQYIAACDAGATDEQQQAGLGMKDNTQRPRRIELLKAEYIEPIGTRPTSSGRMATVWGVTAKGLEVAKS